MTVVLSVYETFHRRQQYYEYHSLALVMLLVVLPKLECVPQVKKGTCWFRTHLKRLASQSFSVIYRHLQKKLLGHFHFDYLNFVAITLFIFLQSTFRVQLICCRKLTCVRHQLNRHIQRRSLFSHFPHYLVNICLLPA